MSLKIIGAGVGRTGTHSLKIALEELGFGKCYHMEELLMHNPQNVKYWEDAKAGKPVNWEELFNGFQSAVDIPTFYFYKELMKVYPGAKVILTTRNEDSWYKSFGDTIVHSSKPSFGQILSMSFRMPFNKKLRQQLNVFKYAGGFLKEFFPDGFQNKAAATKFYNDWNKRVMETVPKEKLLVYNVKEGWEPLCRFLNVPIPAKPFPHSNTTAEFLGRKF
ncbi:MAG TPA: sulfotransferase [Chitinophagales bacterium]|nr:sulfotransferase [Chitinophagales bacterium]